MVTKISKERNSRPNWLNTSRSVNAQASSAGNMIRNDNIAHSLAASNRRVKANRDDTPTSCTNTRLLTRAAARMVVITLDNWAALPAMEIKILAREKSANHSVIYSTPAKKN